MCDGGHCVPNIRVKFWKNLRFGCKYSTPIFYGERLLYLVEMTSIQS